MDAPEITQKHIDRITDERKQRAAIIREHYPQMYAEVMDLAQQFGARMVGIKSKHLTWGNMGEDGVTANVFLANSKSEKHMKQVISKRKRDA